jgi:uncharacterized protein DUF4328
MSSPSPELPWSDDARALRNWFIGYMVVWVAGLALAIPSNFDNLAILLLSIVPYIGCIVYAYKVQDALNRAGLYKPGAWQVIAGAVLLNPLIAGLFIPTSVMWVASRIGRKIRAGTIPATPLASRTTVPAPAGAVAAGVRSGRLRAQWAIALLYAGIGLALLAIISGTAQLNTLGQVAAGVKLPKGAEDESQIREALVLVLHGIVFIGTMVAWLIWQYRAYANLRLVGSRQTEYTPGWSVGYWFIPIVNLVRPYQITKELSQRSESHNDRDQISESGTPLLGGWWASYLLGSMALRVYSGLLDGATSTADLVAATQAGLVSHVVMLVSGILAVLVIRRIVRLQEGFVTATSPAMSMS